MKIREKIDRNSVYKRALLAAALAVSLVLLPIRQAAAEAYFVYGGVLREPGGGKVYVSAGESCELLETTAEGLSRILYQGAEYETDAEIGHRETQDPSGELTESGSGELPGAASGETYEEDFNREEYDYALRQLTAESGDPHEGLLIAHMGVSAAFPENSMAAYLEAALRGYWGIEADVRGSTDGSLICAHDLPAGSDAAAFSEYLDLCATYRTTAVIDLKPTLNASAFCDAVLTTVIGKAMLPSAIFQCDMPEYLEAIRNASGEARLWLLKHGAFTRKEMEYAASLGCECLNSDTWTREAVEEANALGLQTCYYTAESSGKQAELMEMGLSYIMTDGYLVP